MNVLANSALVTALVCYFMMTSHFFGSLHPRLVRHKIYMGLYVLLSYYYLPTLYFSQ